MHAGQMIARSLSTVSLARWPRLLSVVAVTVAGALLPATASATQVDFTTPGAFTWTAPDGVSSVLVKVWGAGGGGGVEGGAGGGGYSEASITVSPGTTYRGSVGSGGTWHATGWYGSDGSGSSFESIGAGGGGGVLYSAGTYGYGGWGMTHLGGNGGLQGSGAGGGGGGAGSLGDGGMGGYGGSFPAYDTAPGGAGGAGGGGAGGAGHHNSSGFATGEPGSAPGGGGGSGSGTGGGAGGDGARGQVTLVFTSGVVLPLDPGSGLAGPQNVSAPTISGTARSGQTLTASPGAWTGNPLPVAFDYQWRRDGADITGAKTQSYTLTSADVGHAIQVRVTAVGYGAAQADSAPTSPGGA